MGLTMSVVEPKDPGALGGTVAGNAEPQATGEAEAVATAVDMPPSATVTLAVELAAVHAALAEATSEADLLAAAMRYFGRSQPTSAYFVRIHADADGHLQDGEISALWEAGQLQYQHESLGRVLPISKWAMTGAWLRNPSDLVAISDVESDPRIDDAMRQQLHANGRRSLALLPLYSRAHRTWQGMISLLWSEPRTFSAEEQSVYALLCDAVASFAANLHIQRSLREVFQETALLYDISAQLSVASTLDMALRAVCIPATGADSAFLGIIERDSAGVPETLRMVAGFAEQPELAKAVIGAAFPIALLPMAQHWIAKPDEPMLISEIATDPRTDAHSRSLYAGNGYVSTVLLPLVVEQQVVGNVSISWRTPKQFTERDERIFLAVSKHAALVLHNRLLVEKSQQALRERAQQSGLLSRVLENLPIGVMLVDAASHKTLLSNAAAAALSPGLRPGGGDASPSHRLLRPGSEEDLPESEGTLQRVLTSGQQQHVDVDVLLADQRRALETTGVPMLGDDGQVRSVLLLLSDVTARREAEKSRAKMQDELIAVQAAALAERSTPIIPISDDIVVVPLIGSLDAERSTQLMDTVPTAASHYEAKVAIIDITGVSTLDTQAARTLIGVARALRLLGIEPVVTGMRAEVAQTLVQLGVRLDGLSTRSNLKSGIAHAQNLLSKRTLNRLR